VAEPTAVYIAEAEALADQTLMKGLTVEKGKLELNLIPPREIVAVWVHAAREMIGDAENYVEMEVKLAGEVERFAFVLQRVGKLTPHEARQAAESAIARVRAVHARDDSNPHGPWCGTCMAAWPCSTWRALDGEETGRG
jgi:hypothetical protein